MWTSTYQKRIEFERKFISPYVNPDARVLDAGCGRYNYLVAKHDVRELVGIDWDRSAISNNECITRGIVADLENLSEATFADGSEFDLVMSYDVVEHLRDPSSFVSGISRILKLGGRFFFATPNTRSIGGLLASSMSTRTLKLLSRVIRGKETTNDAHYYRLNSVRVITECLSNNGFADIHIALLSPVVERYALQRMLYLPDYWIGRTGLIRDYSIRILCVARLIRR